MATTYGLIASTQVGAGGASSFDFQNIPSTYTDLILLISARTNRAAYHESLLMTFNGSASNYYYQRMYLDSTTVYADYASTAMFAGQASGGTASANYFGSSRVEIFNYANTSFYKGSDSLGISGNSSTSALWAMTANRWASTAAINRVTITPENGGTIQQYSSAYLYGVKNS